MFLDQNEDLLEHCFAQGWTDGLPVVPPTRERVEAMIAASGRERDEIVVHYPERSRDVTVEKVAANAVMAGCLPDYVPVVLAVLEAMGDPDHKLHANLTSTGGPAPGFIVNGPIRGRLGMNSKGDMFGPGNRPNSTIGRAVRLTIVNGLGSLAGAGNEGGPLAGTRPILDQSVLGQTARYAGFHIVEDEEVEPGLEPLHVQRGFRPDESALTVFSTFGNIFIAASPDGTAHSIIDTVTHYLVGTGRLRPKGWCVLVLPPQCARIFVRDGWTKRDISEAIVRNTTRTMAWMKQNGESPDANIKAHRGGEVLPGDDDVKVGIADRPEDVMVVVAGAPNGAFIHAILPYAPYGLGSGVTSRAINLPEGT